MNASELQSIVDRAKMVQSNRSDTSLTQILGSEIKKVEDKVVDVMGKSYSDLTDDDAIPKVIEDAANYLTSCHGLWLKKIILLASFWGFFLFSWKCWLFSYTLFVSIFYCFIMYYVSNWVFF